MSANITRMPSPTAAGGNAPLPGNGEAAKADAAKFKPVTEHTAVKRAIPVTDYAGPAVDEPVAETPVVETPAEPTRHQKWLQQQKEKREARDAGRAERATKAQALAADLLKKGDLPGAAKALGLPVSELVTLTNQAAIGVKPEDPVKPLTAEEQRAADEAKFKADRLAFENEQRQWRLDRDVRDYVAANISPVLADKDAFEMIHNVGAESVSAYAYDYMNRHYQATGEKLAAKDVLETIEQQMYDSHVAVLEKAKTLKKVAKLFAPAVSEEDTSAAAEPVSRADNSPLSLARRKLIGAHLAEAEAAEEEPELVASVAPVRPSGVPVAEPTTSADAGKRDPSLRRVVGGVRPLTARDRIEKARREEAEELARQRKK